jgi:PIN domain nuclease of toxin-antitoxin system
MRLLLDTHILLWALAGDARLDATARGWIEDPGNLVLFSAASIWEIAIKSSLHKARFGVRPAEIAEAARATGLTELPVSSRAAALVADLPLHHRDPFDRLLAAQAIDETVRLVTVDPLLAPYTELVTLLA